MSALYAMRYLGHSGDGMGAIYIGRGTIVGVDAANGRYSGTYTEEGGRFKGTIKLSAPAGDVALVTGAQLPKGQAISMQADWPINFADGSAQTIIVNGLPVQVTFEKIGDIP